MFLIALLFVAAGMSISRLSYHLRRDFVIENNRVLLMAAILESSRIMADRNAVLAGSDAWVCAADVGCAEVTSPYSNL